MRSEQPHQAARTERAAAVGPDQAKGVLRGVVLAAVWLILAGAELEPLLMGVICVPLATWLSLRLMPGGVPVRPGMVIALAPRFIWRSLIGGLDVARRAFDPRLPIRPGWIEIATTLPDGGKVALGGELSLMPGTLSAGVDGDRLLIHALDLGQDVEAACRDEERRVRRTLDRPKKAMDSA